MLNKKILFSILLLLIAIIIFPKPMFYYSGMTGRQIINGYCFGITHHKVEPTKLNANAFPIINPDEGGPLPTCFGYTSK